MVPTSPVMFVIATKSTMHSLGCIRKWLCLDPGYSPQGLRITARVGREDDDFVSP